MAFSCDICNREFTEKRSLTRHVKNQHGLNILKIATTHLPLPAYTARKITGRTSDIVRPNC